MLSVSLTPKVSPFQIDFPSGNAVELLEGEEVQISNGYVQGAGSTAMVDRRAHDSSLGLLIGANYNSETMIVNTRIFGHALSGVEIAGGAHATLSNNRDERNASVDCLPQLS